MAKFIAYLIQDGGCDYTIACGHKMIDVPGEDSNEALKNLAEIIKEDYSGEQVLASVVIYEVSSSTKVNVEKIYADYEKKKLAEQNAKQIEKDNAEFERLKQKLGK